MPGVVVLNPATVDGYGNPISVTRDEGEHVNRLLVSGKIIETPIDVAAKRVVGADFIKQVVTDTTYYIAIDVDDSYGSYRHSAGTDIKLVGTSGVLLKSRNSDVWHAFFGSILSINGTQATIGFIQVGALHAADTNQFDDRYQMQSFPVEIDMGVSGGVYRSIAGSLLETTTSVNNLSTLKDVSGNDVVPAVGDLVIKLGQEFGNGSATLHYSFWYSVE